MLFQSCKDDKDIVIIDEELPLKVDHVYMVGDASPVGWNISDPFELTRDASNKYVFTYHGVLKAGEMKFPWLKVIGEDCSFTLRLLTQRLVLMV